MYKSVLSYIGEESIHRGGRRGIYVIIELYEEKNS